MRDERQQDAGLRSRVLKASGWATLGYVIGQVIRFGGNLIMTRLLMPEAFGIMAIAWTVMTGLAMISDTGIRQCIVQSKNGDAPSFLNTAWTIQIIRGVILTIGAVGIAGCFEVAKKWDWFVADSVYSRSDLPIVIAAVAFSALFAGLESTKLATANRHLALARVFAIDLVGQVIGLVVMVCWALIDRTIWALVVGVVIVGPIRVGLSHAALPGMANRWDWDAPAAREIAGFGKWILLSSFLGFLVSNGDRLVLGGLTDANALGQYAVAFLIVGSIQQVIGAIIGNVALPALSEINRTRPERLKATFYRLRTPVDLVALALAGFLFIAGSQITDLLYDDRYRLSGPLVEILALSLIAARYDVAIQCYLALGKSKLIMPVQIIRVLPLFAFTPVAFHYWGLIAATWVIALVPLTSIPMHFLIMRTNRLLDLRREIVVLPSLVVGLVIGQALLFLVGRSG